LIDLHCHILPGLDDGAVDLLDSLAMAAQAQEDGIETVCATPHIRSDHDVRIDELRARVRVLNRELGRAGLSTRVTTGGEVAEAIADDLSADDLRAVSLGGGGRWILLEPAAGPLGERFLSCVERLAKRGHRALVAHPERHFDEHSFDVLGAVVDAGGLVQVTAAMLAEAGPDWAPVRLAERGLVHVLASDAHSSRYGRPLRLSDGLERLGQVAALRPHLNWIARDAPRAIVAGRDLEPPFRRR
jgi:protein-tyrosine phosphatase